MQKRTFKQVDVFTDRRYFGNPLAVVLDGDGLDDALMQRIARWTNLSETTFVLTPTRAEADYRLRIFTTTRELPFAGHPSIGSVHALLEAGRLDIGRNQWIQECAAGLLPVRRSAVGQNLQRIHVRVPTPRISDLDNTILQRLEQALRLSAETIEGVSIVDVGAVWLVADLRTADRVRTLNPDPHALGILTDALGVTGLTVFGRETAAIAALAVRSFCPGEGAFEDPVCGSGNASVAAYLHAHGSIDAIGRSYLASQGRELGRDGFVSVSVDDAGIVEIGGAAVTCIDGVLALD